MAWVWGGFWFPALSLLWGIIVNKRVMIYLNDKWNKAKVKFPHNILLHSTHYFNGVSSSAQWFTCSITVCTGSPHLLDHPGPNGTMYNLYTTTTTLATVNTSTRLGTRPKGSGKHASILAWGPAIRLTHCTLNIKLFFWIRVALLFHCKALQATPYDHMTITQQAA